MTNPTSMQIVVGYVPSPEGRAAAQRAAEEAKLRGAALVVVNSSRGDAYLDAGYASEAQIDELRQQLSAAGLQVEVRRPVRGLEAAVEVLDAARDTGASLIVIGLRRRTAVGKLILGSTAQRILLDAPCPVLAVKASN